MNKKMLGIAVVVSLGAIGGIALVDGANSLSGNLAGNTPLTSSNPYKMTIDQSNPLKKGESDSWSAKTTSGTSISFGTTYVQESTDGAFVISSATNVLGGIYNIDAIHGMKSLKFTIASAASNTRAYEFYTYFGYSSFPNASAWSNGYNSFDRVMHTDNADQIVLEYQFPEEAPPSYFAFVGQSQIWAATTTVTSVEITYSCEDNLSQDISSISVNSEAQLQLALEYYRNYASSAKGSIVLTDNISIIRSLDVQGSQGKPFDITLNLAGHTLSSAQGNYFGYEPSITNYAALIRVSEYSTVTVTGNGTLDTSGCRAVAMSFPYGRGTENSVINVESGTFKTYPGDPAIYLSGVTYNEGHNSGTLNIKGGTFMDGNSATNIDLILTAENFPSTIVITGGTFTGYDPSAYVDNDVYAVRETSLATGVSQYAVEARESHSVSSEEEFKTAIAALADKTGVINITAGFTLTSEATIESNSNIAILGNNNTISCEGLAAHAIYAKTNAALYIKNLTLSNFSTDNTNNHYPIVFYGGGKGGLTNVTVSGTNADAPYSWADVWVGDHREVTIDGGNIGKVFVNASEGAGILRAGHVILENVPTIGTLILEYEKNSKYAFGSYEVGTVYMRGTYEGEVSNVTTVTNNPQNLDLTNLTDVTNYGNVANVSSAEEFNIAANSLASSGGIINITSDFSYSVSLVVPDGTITINGNSHTITPTAEFTSSALPRNGTFVQVKGTLYINDLTFDFTNVTNIYGIMSLSGATLNMANCTVKNFSSTPINAGYCALYYFSSGGGSLTNCTVESAMNGTAYASNECAEIYIGVGRNITVSNGSYGKFFVRSNELVSVVGNYIRSASLTFDAGAKADEIITQCKATTSTWTGKIDGTETTFEAGSLIHHAALTITTDCTVTTVITNPDNLEGVSATKGEDGVYAWSVPEGKYLAENVTDLTYPE